MARRRLRRLVTRRRVKWVGTVLSVVVASAWTVSIWTRYGVTRTDRHSDFLAFVSRGRVVVLGITWKGDALLRATRFDFYRRSESRPGIDLKVELEHIGGEPGWFPWESQKAYAVAGVVKIPLWLPFLLIAAPTAWLWHTDRRAKPWQCPKCRYDLRGLDGGVCPECGHELKPSNAAGVVD